MRFASLALAEEKDAATLVANPRDAQRAMQLAIVKPAARTSCWPMVVVLRSTITAKRAMPTASRQCASPAPVKAIDAATPRGNRWVAQLAARLVLVQHVRLATSSLAVSVQPSTRTAIHAGVAVSVSLALARAGDVATLMDRPWGARLVTKMAAAAIAIMGTTSPVSCASPTTMTVKRAVLMVGRPCASLASAEAIDAVTPRGNQPAAQRVTPAEVAAAAMSLTYFPTASASLAAAMAAYAAVAPNVRLAFAKAGIAATPTARHRSVRHAMRRVTASVVAAATP